MRGLSELRLPPNWISISRVALAVAFVLLDTRDERIVLVMIALTTDYLDGWLARKAGWATRMGALLDPFADRVFVLVGVSVFLFEGKLSTLGYFVMISRDLMTAIGFLVARAMPSLRAVVFQARLSGKIVTVLQLATFVAILISPPSATVMLIFVGIISVWSIVDYTMALNRGRQRAK